MKVSKRVAVASGTQSGSGNPGDDMGRVQRHNIRKQYDNHEVIGEDRWGANGVTCMRRGLSSYGGASIQ